MDNTMVLDGKENVQPQPPPQNESTKLDPNIIKPSERLVDKPSTSYGAASSLFDATPPSFEATPISLGATLPSVGDASSLNGATSTSYVVIQRPPLFSEILYNDNAIANPVASVNANANDMANPNDNGREFDLWGANYSRPRTSSNSPQPSMTNFFDPTFAPPTSGFGAIGSELARLRESTSPKSEPSTLLGVTSNTNPSSDSVIESPYLVKKCGDCDFIMPDHDCTVCIDGRCLKCYVNRVVGNRLTGIIITPPGEEPQPTYIDTENFCLLHYDEVFRYVCEHCNSVICQECLLREHDNHRCTYIGTFLMNADKRIQYVMDVAESGKYQIKRNIDLVLRYSHCLEREAHDILQRNRKYGVRAANANTMNNALQRYDAKDQAFVDTVESFRQQNTAIYMDQLSIHRSSLAAIADITDQLKKIGLTTSEFTPIRLAKIIIEAEIKIRSYTYQSISLAPIQVSVQQYLMALEQQKQQQQLMGSQNNMNMMYPDMPSTSWANNGIKPMRRPIIRSNRGMLQNNNNQFLLPLTRSPWNSPFSMGIPMLSNDHWTATNDFFGFNTFNNMRLQYGLSSYHNYSDNKPPVGRCILNYDFPIRAIRREEPSYSFAFDGSDDGHLSRPWGVCVNKDGFIIVGDRRNNRIQIFHPDGQLKLVFGSKGSGDGELDLPAGVTTDRLNRIIVADKDNHRVQIFTMCGNFILKFGGYGRDLGEFQYPWDVATNTHGYILVSDTRNHRVQMFSSLGHFITKYSFDSHYDRHLKNHITPRGVCFTPEGDILVTDFENHRIMKMDASLTIVKAVVGREGEGAIHEFNRPSGLCCDDNGHLVIADSKNQRVVVYDTNFNFKWMMDLRRSNSELNNEKDRPSDVAILPDGRIVILFETSPDMKDYPHPLKTFVQIH